MEQHEPIGKRLDEYLAKTEKEHAERLRTLSWGGWKLDPKHLTLTFDGYDVDLEEMTDSAQILDWIFQLKDKVWVTPQVMADFLDALGDLLHPQANYCKPGGKQDGRPEGSRKGVLQQVKGR